MKKFLVTSIILGCFYSLFIFFAFVIPLDVAIIPKYMVPASYISSLLRNSPRYLSIILVIIGLGFFSFSIYQFAGIIYKRTKNWWKTLYFTLIITLMLLYGLLTIAVIFAFGILPPINNVIICVFLFSTILLFPVKEFRHLLIPYVIYAISYLLLLETYKNGLLAYMGITVYLSPLYVLILCLLTYSFIDLRKIYIYLAVLLLFIPLKVKGKSRWMYSKPEGVQEYTMIVPSQEFYQVKQFKKATLTSFMYVSILEPDSSYYESSMYNNVKYPFAYYKLNLNEERVKEIRNLLNNRKIFVGRIWRDKIEKNILERWESKKEKGVVTGKIEGEIPDRIGLFRHINMKFNWSNGILRANLKDATSVDEKGNFAFRYIPEGTYEVLLLYKRNVPHYSAEIPFVYSKNDTIQLGTIEIK